MILLAQIAVGAVVESIPFLDIASLIFNGAITVAQLSQTIVEVVDSPFVFTTDIARTFDLTLTIDPRLHDARVSAGGDRRHLPGRHRLLDQRHPGSDHETDAGHHVERSAAAELFELPAGEQIQLNVYMYSPTGWQAGQGQSAWIDAKGDGTGEPVHQNGRGHGDQQRSPA